MSFDQIAWIFDSRVDSPVSIKSVPVVIFRWTVITLLCLILGVVALLIAGACVGFDVKRMMDFVPYVRAGVILLVCCFMVYATYRNAAHRNRQKQQEDEALYREIAAYYRERKNGGPRK